MSEEFKNSEVKEEGKKPFSVNISDEDFAAESIPAPEGDVPADSKPHKVVRYVDNAPKKEEPKAEKKKGGFLGEFIAGAAAGAKTVGEGISAGVKTVSEMADKPKAEKTEQVKEEKPVKKEKAPKPEKVAPAKAEDETQFPKEEKKTAAGGIMEKLNALPVGAIIGGAAAILVVLIAIILLAATSCTPNGDTPSDNGSSGGIVVGPTEENSGSSDENSSEEVPELPDRKDQFVEAFNANNDVMAWLYIPGLEDVDAGVAHSPDSSYPYDKRDITGKKATPYWEKGAYYTHYRNMFGAKAKDLSINTVIFGHSDLGHTNLANGNDDPTGPLFSQLFSFKSPEFAQNTPYIYLTLPNEDTVWEVFAVFYNDAKAMNSTFAGYYKRNAGSLWYIEPSPVESEYQLMLNSIKERSLYDYGIEVTTEDKILTLSTCTVGFGYDVRENYRFVVVAKLVENADPAQLKEKATFTINANAPVPKSYQEEFNGYANSWKAEN